ncbi:hypothetical protein [Actinacidiphila sp. ITFR-21]|nr:hypothetical protein [Streptomyces sp. ITFR-21]WNI14717.1 hypothetical protein RLT57_03615 [Streptomyces sp. ITFR-21]
MELDSQITEVRDSFQRFVTRNTAAPDIDGQGVYAVGMVERKQP